MPFVLLVGPKTTAPRYEDIAVMKDNEPYIVTILKTSKMEYPLWEIGVNRKIWMDVFKVWNGNYYKGQ